MSDMSLSTVQHTRINVLRVFAVLFFVIVCVSQSPWPSDGPVFTTLTSTGLVATFIAIVGRMWSTLYVGGRKNITLVTDGPYSMTRNPLYFFSLVGIAGIGAQTGSILTMLIFVLTALTVFSATVAREEKFLRQRFGSSFRDYYTSTPRLLPALSLWKDAEELAIRPKNLLRTLRDGFVFLIPLPILALVGAAQDADVLPVLLRLPF